MAAVASYIYAWEWWARTLTRLINVLVALLQARKSAISAKISRKHNFWFSLGTLYMLYTYRCDFFILCILGLNKMLFIAHSSKSDENYTRKIWAIWFCWNANYIDVLYKPTCSHETRKMSGLETRIKYSFQTYSFRKEQVLKDHRFINQRS